MGAARIGSGNLSERIAITTGDELEGLADQFNDMAGRLQESYAGLEGKVELRTRELRELLEQQTAAAAVLRVISSTPGELSPVFDLILRSVTRICDAKMGTLLLRDGDSYKVVASLGVPPEVVEYYNRRKTPAISPQDLARVTQARRTIHVIDARDTEAYAKREEYRVATVELLGARTFINVPMFKDDQMLGFIGIYRDEVRPFDDKQIALVENFGTQAAIAVENARLLNELRQRTTDLSVTLEQQSAAADVLRIMNSSTGNLSVVFDAILDCAARVCEADAGILFRLENGAYQAVAFLGVQKVAAEYFRSHPVAAPESRLTQVIAERKTVHIVDTRDTELYREREEWRVVTVELLGARTLLNVPMLQDEGLGVIGLYRKEVQPFDARQIAWVENLANQAAVAMANAHLLNELRARTGELTTSLEQQTVTAEVLRAISDTRGELSPVFDLIVRRVTGACEAASAMLQLRDGEVFRPVASFGMPPEAAQYYLHEANPPPAATLAHHYRTRETIHVIDARATEEYAKRVEYRVATVELMRARTFLNVPLFKGGELLGVLGIYRSEVRPFDSRQIAWLENFAHQIIIAIENAHLLNELRLRTAELTNSLEHQRAAAEVLRLINSSGGDLSPVFDAILECATQMCGAKAGVLFRHEDGVYHTAALLGVPEKAAEFFHTHPVEAYGSRLAQMVAEKRIVHVIDAREGELYRIREDWRVMTVELLGARTFLNVPMMKDDEGVGVIGLYRDEVRPFEAREIALAENLASQAAIAIANARLLNALRARTGELTKSLEQETATAEVLRLISSTPGALSPVLDTILANAARICEAKGGSVFGYENGAYIAHATLGMSAEADAFFRGGPVVPTPGSGFARITEERKTLHVIDARETAAYRDAETHRVATVDLLSARTFLNVPMLKDDELLGIIGIYRDEVRPFDAQEIALVENFASQAVIAIVNARLLNELRAKTGELEQSVDELRALGEVTQAVNSTLDLQTVLSTIVAKAVQLLRHRGRRDLRDGPRDAGVPAARDLRHDAGLIAVIRPRRGSHRAQPAARSRKQRRTATVRHGSSRLSADAPVRQILLRAGYRALLVVPLLARRSAIVGALVVRRKATRASSRRRPSSCCRPSRRSRCWRSRMRVCSARSRRRAASSRWRASTSRSSSPT